MRVWLNKQEKLCCHIEMKKTTNMADNRICLWYPASLFVLGLGQCENAMRADNRSINTLETGITRFPLQKYHVPRNYFRNTENLFAQVWSGVKLGFLRFTKTLQSYVSRLTRHNVSPTRRCFLPHIRQKKQNDVTPLAIQMKCIILKASCVSGSNVIDK